MLGQIPCKVIFHVIIFQSKKLQGVQNSESLKTIIFLTFQTTVHRYRSECSSPCSIWSATQPTGGASRHTGTGRDARMRRCRTVQWRDRLPTEVNRRAQSCPCQRTHLPRNIHGFDIKLLTNFLLNIIYFSVLVHFTDSQFEMHPLGYFLEELHT